MDASPSLRVVVFESASVARLSQVGALPSKRTGTARAMVSKTVFMDLCAKGSELRALTFDDVLLAAFSSLWDNYDSAAWDEFQVTAVHGNAYCARDYHWTSGGSR